MKIWPLWHFHYFLWSACFWRSTYSDKARVGGKDLGIFTVLKAEIWIHNIFPHSRQSLCQIRPSQTTDSANRLTKGRRDKNTDSLVFMLCPLSSTITHYTGQNDIYNFSASCFSMFSSYCKTVGQHSFQFAFLLYSLQHHYQKTTVSTIILNQI